MIPLFSTQQVREADTFAENQLGMPSLLLMENAAIEIYNIAIEKINDLNIPVQSIGFVCGKGNNGGDGFAAARHFANNGFNIIVLHVADETEMSNDAQTNFLILRRLAEQNKNISVKKYNSEKDLTGKNSVNDCDVIFDALLGTGTKGDLQEPYSSIVKKLNSLKAYKIAVDVPTGLSSDSGYGNTVFDADLTITLGNYKKGLFVNTEFCGDIVKGDIGLDSGFFDRYIVNEYLVEPEDAYIGLPGKKKSAHKYSSGKVLTIAGSGKLPGAAALTSKAVLKAGAGASILAFPKSVRKLVNKNAVEVIVENYDDAKDEFLKIENLKELKKRIEWADVVAIGPGLGREESTQQAVVQIIKDKRYNKIVLDADAIFAIGSDKYKELDLTEAVLTPHHGEFSNLLGIETGKLSKDILGLGKSFAFEKGCYLVLKGSPTIIFNPEGEAFINTTGNPGMAKFGTGDVLTGILAGVIAQSDDLESAIITGVYLHSLTADLLLNKYTEYSFTASDIINKFPESIKFIRKTFA